MKLHYHRTTFRLLQCEPVLSGIAVKKIEALEKMLGVRLPESIREWYSLEGAVERFQLEEYILRFQPFGVEHNTKNLKKPPYAKYRTRPPSQSPYLWVVGAYSSGVYYALTFPSEPDPIVHCFETDGSHLDGADEWSERPFSAFAFTCCWHNLLHSTKNLSGVDPSFSPAKIDALTRSFDEGPRVARGDAPSERPHPFTREGLLPVNRFQFFFFGPSGMIHLLSRDDPTVSEMKVAWQLSSPDEPALLELAAQLKGRGILPCD